MVGFQPPTAAALAADPDAVGDTRTVSFSFTRPTPAKLAIPAIPAVAATATAPAVDAVPAVPAVPAGTETVSLVIPVLAIVNPPTLSIKTVSIIFDMEVKSSSSSKSSTDEALSASVDASAKWGAVKVAVHIQGSVATHKENTRSTDNSAKYHVELEAADPGPTEGLRRVLDIMNSAIVPVPK